MRSLTVFCIVCVALMFGISSAQAAIIVTEGKVASTGKTTLKSKKSVSLRRVAVASAASETVLPGTTNDDESSLSDSENLDESDEGDELSDLDNPAPEGWKCEDMGGGVEYCEEDDDDDEAGTGAGVGAAGGGGLGDDTMMSSEDPIAGCSGSGGSSGAPWMLAALGLLLLPLRRSRI